VRCPVPHVPAHGRLHGPDQLGHIYRRRLTQLDPCALRFAVAPPVAGNAFTETIARASVACAVARAPVACGVARSSFACSFARPWALDLLRSAFTAVS
jgi:hypothetical protein